MKFDTVTVQLLLCVAEEGSISRAADRLNLAVAAASKRVSDLEGQLAVKLFKRVAHGVQVTDVGARLLEHIRQIDYLAGRLEDEARVLSHGDDGHIIIGAPKAAIIQFLSSDLARLKRAYPNISLKVVEENSKIIQQLLRDRVIDVGIYDKKSGFLDLERHEYRQDKLVLVYSRRHFEFSTASIGIDEMLELPIVSLGRGSAILTAIQRAFRSRGRVFEHHYVVSGFDTMLSLVREGLGVGLMPPDILRSFHPDTAVGSVDLVGEWADRAYVLSKVDGRVQDALLRNAVEVLLRTV